MRNTLSTVIAGREMKVEFGGFGMLSNAAILMSYGDTVILTTGQKNQEMVLISSLLVLNMKKDYILLEKSQEDLLKEKEDHQKKLFYMEEQLIEQ